MYMVLIAENLQGEQMVRGELSHYFFEQEKKLDVSMRLISQSVFERHRRNREIKGKKTEEEKKKKREDKGQAW